MNTGRRKRHGVTLALVVMVLAALASIFAVLSFATIDAHKQRQAAVLERAARSAADSAALLVQDDADGWKEKLATGPRHLDIGELIPAFATGAAVLSIHDDAAQKSIHIDVKVVTKRLTASAKRSLTVW